MESDLSETLEKLEKEYHRNIYESLSILVKFLKNKRLSKEERNRIKKLIRQLESSIEFTLNSTLGKLFIGLGDHQFTEYNLINNILRELIKIDSPFVKEQLLYCYKFKDQKVFWGNHKFIIEYELHDLIKNSNLSFLSEIYSELLEANNKRLIFYAVEGFVHLKDKSALDIILDGKNYNKIKGYLKNDRYLFNVLQMTIFLLNPDRFIQSILDNLIDFEHLFIFDFVEDEWGESLKESIINEINEFNEQTISNLIDYVTKNEDFWNQYFLLFILLQRKDERIFDLINHLIELGIFKDNQTIREVFEIVKSINSQKFREVLEKMMKLDLPLGTKNFVDNDYLQLKNIKE